MILETVYSLNNVPVRLTEERWEHIVGVHPYMTRYYEEMLDAVDDPEYILPGHKGSLIAVVALRKKTSARDVPRTQQSGRIHHYGLQQNFV